MTNYLRPNYFFLGLLLSFLVCCSAGFFISKSERLNHFSRFFLEICPESFFYPTASELLQTVRHQVSKDKILVLIGGSSILRGDGQNLNELWSIRLQKLLGDQYGVVNYAADGASFSSYGGTVFRMLRKEYPKIIFVAASYQFNSEGYLDGYPPYQYLFWDAYYKNLFKPYPEEKAIIKKLRADEMHTADGLELHIMSFLDSYFYFKNLWNWVSYRFFSTMFHEYVVSHPFQGRRHFPDNYIPQQYMQELIKILHDKEHMAQYTKLIEDTAFNLVSDLSKHPLQIKPEVQRSGIQGYDEVFSPRDRSKILMVETTYNTQVIAAVPKPYQDGYWFMNNESHKMMASLGYHVIDVGQDFTGDDFKDIDHFLPSGGNKLADQVAEEVKHVAATLHYLK